MKKPALPARLENAGAIVRRKRPQGLAALGLRDEGFDPAFGFVKKALVGFTLRFAFALNFSVSWDSRGKVVDVRELPRRPPGGQCQKSVSFVLVLHSVGHSEGAMLEGFTNDD